MKKIFLLITLTILVFNLFSQHFIPLKLAIYPNDFNMSYYGGLSLDKGSGSEFTSSISNTTQTGFVVNAFHRKRQADKFHQFIIDFNPVIVNWQPFTWNKVVKQPVDSFSVAKLPFAEDAFLHIGWHANSLRRIYGTKSRDEYLFSKFFGEMYYRPHNIEKDNQMYRFSVFNVNLGTQFSYVKKNIPTIGNFLIGLSLQMNFMLTNESDEYSGSLASLVSQSKYAGKNYWGPGAKIIVQLNHLNIYVEGRQYWGLDDGYYEKKLSQEPIILVGAFTNIQWYSKKGNNNPNNEDKEIWK